jgi:hypothetical protein
MMLAPRLAVVEKMMLARHLAVVEKMMLVPHLAVENMVGYTMVRPTMPT